MFRFFLNKPYLCVVQNFIQYKSFKIAYQVTGKGDSVVFLHGFLESAKMWNSIINQLDLQKQFIVIDLPGHGKSEHIPVIHTMEFIADIVKRVLDCLNVKKISLIGHSMGGYVALAFADLFPNYVTKLVLLNSTAQKDNQYRKELRVRAVEMAKKNYHNLVSMSINNLFLEKNREKLQDQIYQTKKEALEVSVESYIAYTYAMLSRENREDVLCNVSFQKLMLIGKNDSVLNPELLVEEAKRVNTSYVLLSNGHMSHLEDQKELLQVLTSFLM